MRLKSFLLIYLTQIVLVQLCMELNFSVIFAMKTQISVELFR